MRSVGCVGEEEGGGGARGGRRREGAAEPLCVCVCVREREGGAAVAVVGRPCCWTSVGGRLSVVRRRAGAKRKAAAPHNGGGLLLRGRWRSHKQNTQTHRQPLTGGKATTPTHAPCSPKFSHVAFFAKVGGGQKECSARCRTQLRKKEAERRASQS